MYWTAISFYIGLFALLQLGVAATLFKNRERRTLRIIHILLLALNGGASIFFAVLFMGKSPDWVYAWAIALDAPTGLFVLLLSIILLRRWKSPMSDQPTTGINTPVVTAISIAILIAAIIVSIWENNYMSSLYKTTPLYIGYGILLVSLTNLFKQAVNIEDKRFYSLLLAGYGARVVEFSFSQTNILRPHNLFQYTGPAIQRLITASNDALELLLLPVAAVSTFSLWRQSKHGGQERTLASIPLATFAAAAALGIAQKVSPPDGDLPYILSLSLITLIIIRPLFIGFAFESRQTLRIIGFLGIGATLFIGIKALLVAVVPDAAIQEVSALDLAAVGLSVLGLVLVRYATQGWPHIGYNPELPTPSAAPTETVTPPSQRVQLLIQHLLEQEPQPGRFDLGFATDELCAVLGIQDKHLKALVDRTEQVLQDAALDTPTGPMVLVNIGGVRRRKFYRLSQEGREAARGLLNSTDG